MFRCPLDRLLADTTARPIELLEAAARAEGLVGITDRLRQLGPTARIPAVVTKLTGRAVTGTAAGGALSAGFWRCKGEAVSAVSDTAFPGPGVASTGLRRVWRHGGSRYLLHFGVTF